MIIRISQSILLACCLIISGACQQQSKVIDSILKQGELVIVTRNAPTTYYELHDEPAGLEYEMTRAFARYLGVKPRYIIKDTTSEILATLKSGEAQIAAAGLTRTQQRLNSFLFGPTYQEVIQQVVCRRGGPNPRKVDQLNGLKLIIASGTSYEEKILQLQKQHPEIEWNLDHNADTESLLERVWQKKIDCTIADSNIVDINRRYYPELRVRFNLGESEQLAWALPHEAMGLQDKLEDWFEQYRQAGKLDALLEKHYGFIEVFDYVDTRRFARRIHTVLPKYRPEFQAAAKKYKLDWLLLAAQSYQESHWRASARSPTGVRGMMMLTLTTAREMGVKSRLDPKQSIHGGARYFHQLHRRIPESVKEPDRTWFALAAYNVGMGHLYDARNLAERLEKDPDQWHDLSEVLPLLSHKKYYKTLNHGYARGREPVMYVDRIRDYHDILQQTLNQQ